MTYEVPLGYLAGQVVTVATSLFDGATPFVELDGKRVLLFPVDPVRNGRRQRPLKTPSPARAEGPVDFDPSRAMDVDNEEDEEDADD